jgi:ABC-type branched-subunit amino acid transport system ATPase component
MTASTDTTQTPPAPASGAPRLECSDVTVRFGGVVAVNSVSLSVPAQSIVGLVGPNGAGKSTLFSVLSGLRRPNAGTVHMDGVEVTSMSAQRRARHGLGRTFQHPEMFSGLTVREHLMLTHRVSNNRRRIWTDMVTARGFRKADSEEVDRVDTLLRALNLTRIGHQPVAGLPLGMTRLVELGRALAGNPSVLLLDEPSSGLDANETAHVMEIFRLTVERRGVSLVLVEHDVSMVLKLCDQVNVLDFGSMLASGTPDEIRDNEAVRAAYLGDDGGASSSAESAAAEQAKTQGADNE